MTQHTETDTPRTEGALERARLSYVDPDNHAAMQVGELVPLCRQLERELAALQAKLSDNSVLLDNERVAVAVLDKELENLRTQLDEERALSSARMVTLEKWKEEMYELRRQVAQAQNEALERAAKVCDARANHWIGMAPKAEARKSEGSLCAMQIRHLKSPNSAEGEPG